ncbi:hypothetical protein OE88DRAFT_1810755 [Heliocybe sulcata]|uniref:Tyrosine-protein kinase ephrin type A/B receptor-like domain-containing protein n=1 Tax=Heliocybe sulcata TaxID=5364 RepID=A0A5C3MRI0_9AGAM|nr:hypothetical protein OE88DRAFT_1810755 [Heliocybe sulcata]
MLLTSLSSALALAALATHASATQACSPGHYSSNGQTPCTACPAGSYQSRKSRLFVSLAVTLIKASPPESGATSCTSAQAGWYASGTGNSAQTQCGQGYYSTGGAASCTLCPAGTYCNSNTQTSPQMCQPGRYSPSAGAKQDCLQCPAGTFNNVYGATKCCSCLFWMDQVGQTHCFNCPNRGNFQQGWSPAGSTSSGQCIAAAGALSSCPQGSDGSCPSTGGAIASQHRRSPLSGEFCEKPGHKACPVWNAVGDGSTSKKMVYKYECVNIAGDIESCGGCVDDPSGGKPSPDGGRDCSAIPNVDDVACRNGTCKIMKCSKGYVLSADGANCAPAAHKRASHPHGVVPHGSRAHAHGALKAHN